MTTDDDELRTFAEALLVEHDPMNQEHSYYRCALCGYTGHPCDTYDLAEGCLRLLNAR